MIFRDSTVKFIDIMTLNLLDPNKISSIPETNEIGLISQGHQLVHSHQYNTGVSPLRLPPNKPPLLPPSRPARINPPSLDLKTPA